MSDGAKLDGSTHNLGSAAFMVALVLTVLRGYFLELSKRALLSKLCHVARASVCGKKVSLGGASRNYS